MSLRTVLKAKLSIQEITTDVIQINQMQTIKINHPIKLENCTFVLYVDMRKYGFGIERTLPIFCNAVAMTGEEIFGRNDIPSGSKSGQSMQHKLENLAGFAALNITGKILYSALLLVFLCQVFGIRVYCTVAVSKSILFQFTTYIKDLD